MEELVFWCWIIRENVVEIPKTTRTDAISLISATQKRPKILKNLKEEDVDSIESIAAKSTIEHTVGAIIANFLALLVNNSTSGGMIREIVSAEQIQRTGQFEVLLRVGSRVLLAFGTISNHGEHPDGQVVQQDRLVYQFLQYHCQRVSYHW